MDIRKVEVKLSFLESFIFDEVENSYLIGKSTLTNSSLADRSILVHECIMSVLRTESAMLQVMNFCLLCGILDTNGFLSLTGRVSDIVQKYRTELLSLSPKDM